MQDGVRRSEAFVCILSEGYFESEYCCKEMRWAIEKEKPILSTYKNGMNVGALLNTAPKDIRDQIKTVDSIGLDAGDSDVFELKVKKLTKRAEKIRAGEKTSSRVSVADAEAPGVDPPPNSS